MLPSRSQRGVVVVCCPWLSNTARSAAAYLSMASMPLAVLRPSALNAANSLRASDVGEPYSRARLARASSPMPRSAASF